MSSQEKAGSDAYTAWERSKDEYLMRRPEMRGIAFEEGGGGDSANIAGPQVAAEASDNAWSQFRYAVIKRIKIRQNVHEFRHLDYINMLPKFL